MSDIMTGQGVLLPDRPGIERLNAAAGIVHTADLEWPLFDPERVMTMVEYLGELGSSIAEYPREDTVTDSALQLFGNDFRQAEPANLNRGLYVPFAGPKKSVVTVARWSGRLARSGYPGTLPFTTGIAVPEDIYQEIARSPAHLSNQVDNRTQLKNSDNPIVEAKIDKAGESVIYAQTDKHEGLEARDRYIMGEQSVLRAVRKCVTQPDQLRRLSNLEQYRLEALASIQEMVRVACKSLGYGTNQTRSTMNVVASNTHRSPEAGKWWAIYTTMAVRYKEEVRGKIAQSIHSCMDQIGTHSIHAFNNLYREYTDD